MAIGGATRALLVLSVDRERLGVLERDVERVLPILGLRPSLEPTIEGLVEVEGTLVPVLDLRHGLGLPPRRLGAGDALVIVSSGGTRVGLHAETLPAQVTLAAERAATGAGEASRLEGATRLRDGLLLISDPERFARAFLAPGA